MPQITIHWITTSDSKVTKAMHISVDADYTTDVSHVWVVSNIRLVKVT